MTRFLSEVLTDPWFWIFMLGVGVCVLTYLVFAK
jgi:hypothetical protein